MVGLLVSPVLGGSSTVLAQGEGLILSTLYPGITAKAGETAEFSLNIENKSGTAQDLEMSVVSIPEGWEGRFEGAGKTIQRVFVKNNDSAIVDFEVKIPSEASDGNYKIEVKASGKNVSQVLSLGIKISEQIQAQGSLATQYPELRGPSDAVFKFRVDLTNNSSKDQSYSLGAKAPEGWEVSFTPSSDSKQIASISLQAGKSQGLDVEIKPPRAVKAGKYNIPIAAVSADETLETELQVIITGTYSIALSTPSGRLNMEAYAGKESSITLRVTNTGSADLKDINFSSSEPSNWSVTFKPEKLDVLQAGQSQEIKAFVKPSSRAIAGDYAVKVTASTNETNDEAELRVMVKTSTIWGIIGVLIIIVLVGGLYWIFKVYGRR